jgi:hypothetical protein
MIHKLPLLFILKEQLDGFGGSAHQLYLKLPIKRHC